MPELNGIDLAARIRISHPMTRTLFTSGFTESAIAHRRMLEPGAFLLQKPFTPGALAMKVREVLDRPVEVLNELSA